MKLFLHDWLIFLVAWTNLIVVAGAIRVLRLMKVFDDRLAFILGISCLIYPIFGVPTAYLLIHSGDQFLIFTSVVVSTLASMKISSLIYSKRKHGRVDTETNALS